MDDVQITMISKGGKNPGGKPGLTVIFLFFALVGCFFTFAVSRNISQGWQARSWTKVECEIVTSSVAENYRQNHRIADFVLAVTYHYFFNGENYTANRIWRNQKTFSDYREAYLAAEKFPAGSKQTCYVNPASPTVSILVQDNIFSVLGVFFPLVIVAIGVGGIFWLWRRPRPIQMPGSSSSNIPLLFFFSIFLAMGGLAFYGFLLKPLILAHQATVWPAIPCEVIASQVDSHRGRKGGTTYNVNIFYRYEVGGREYKSNRYHLFSGSSSGYSAKQAIVDDYPPGAKKICYVNPNDPTDAVLNRKLNAEIWFGLIPLLFIGIGGAGLIATLKNKLKRKPKLKFASSLS